MTSPNQKRRSDEIAVLRELIWSLELVAARGGQLANQAGAEIGRHEKRLHKLLDAFGAGAEQGPPIAWSPAFLSSVSRTQRRLAELELKLAAIAVADVRFAVREERLAPTDRLIAASAAAVRWGADPEAFPGLD